MKTALKERYKNNPELAERLEEVKEEIEERLKYDSDFNLLEVEEIFYDFGLEPDYIFEVLNEIF